MNALADLARAYYFWGLRPGSCEASLTARHLSARDAKIYDVVTRLRTKWIERPRPSHWFNPRYRRRSGAMRIGRPGRHPEHFVSVTSLLNPEGNESTACLVGDYIEADRFLWVAVCMGFPCMVQTALDKGADASRKFSCRTHTGAIRDVDLLFLAFMKSDAHRISVHRSYLMGNDLGCCDAARIWNVRVGDTFNDEEMNGYEVALQLVKAGANPFRKSLITEPEHNRQCPPWSFQAVDWIPELGPLHRERLLNLALPVVAEPTSRARL